jgi:chromosome segregation ATPase
VQTSSQLNDQLAKKNAELADLRSKLVELEKTINQNEVLRQENIQLNESLRKKHSELSEAADKAYFLEKRVRELEGTSDKSPKVVQLAQEVELLEAAIAKKEQEVAKLRQGSQLLQSNIDELEIELERVRSRLSAGEKSSESERSELKGRLSVVELRAVEYERKMAGLEEVRAIMGEQINTLTAEIHIKYENQQRLELEIKQERGRTKAL